jgi:hypothetical protein
MQEGQWGVSLIQGKVNRAIEIRDSPYRGIILHAIATIGDILARLLGTEKHQLASTLSVSFSAPLILKRTGSLYHLTKCKILI